MKDLEQKAREFVEKRMIPMIVDEDTHFHVADLLADFARQQVAERERQIADELEAVADATAGGGNEIGGIVSYIQKLRGEGE